ncbi:MAG: septum formation inhibitor Maf [Betaproteobacteria bacterium]|nr:septum formation inhibitor Maf [Betaproteobacteria bacterium]
MRAQLILASTSPYRKELLARLQLHFDVHAPQVDEAPRAGESFLQTAVRLAREKALAIAQSQPNAIVIGADQVASCEGERLDKPGTAERALAQLQLQRGKTSEFITAVCVDGLLRRYITLENPLDCAGAAKSEGLGIALIESIEGPDPTALVGLPLIALTDLLKTFDVSPLSQS